MFMTSPPLILASTSFWRKELFSWLKLPFQTIAPQFEESAIPFSQFGSPQRYVQFLSAGKAMSILNHHSEAVIISADTIVFFHGQVFGKPEGVDGARDMLRMLRGHSHHVYTGVHIQHGQRSANCVVESIVVIDAISNHELEQYLATSESLNKAGSYSITGHAKKFVHLKDGSLTNVLGLPLNETASLLQQWAIDPPIDVTNVIRQHLSVDR